MDMMDREEIEITLKKSKYWNKAVMRGNQGRILKEELMREVKRLGVSILFILEDYAKREKKLRKNDC